MKRWTQISISILFIFTVISVYLGFDKAVSHAVHRRSSQFTSPKPIEYTSSPLGPMKNRVQGQRHTRTVRSKLAQVKSAQFHKSKTGIKIDQVNKAFRQHKPKKKTSNVRV